MIDFPGLSTEEQLLLACARTSPDVRQHQRITSLLTSNIDWPEMIETALWHGTLPLLHNCLRQQQAELIPQQVIEDIQQRVERGTRQRMLQTAELIRVLDLFDTYDIPAIPYKGPVLALAAYGDLSLRTFGDLDLLLPQQQILTAKQLLLDAGYRPEYLLSERAEKRYLRDECEYNFRRDSDGVEIELHWELLPRDMSLAIAPLSFWDDLQPMTMAGKSISVLSPEKTLLVLCIHGSKHQWQLLKWVSDIAEWLRVSPDLDWEQTLELADQCGARRMLLLGPLLAHELLDPPLSPLVQQSIDSHPGLEILKQHVYRHLFSSRTYLRGLAKQIDRFPFYFSMRERRTDKLRLLRRLAHMFFIELKKKGKSHAH